MGRKVEGKKGGREGRKQRRKEDIYNSWIIHGPCEDDDSYFITCSFCILNVNSFSSLEEFRLV